MGKGFKHGISVFGDGSEGSAKYLNVICCESEDDLPINADEYTIAVISDVEMTGYSISTNYNEMKRFSKDAFPVYVGGKEGHVYIRIGDMRQSNIDVSVGGMVFSPIDVCQSVSIGNIVGQNIAYKQKTALIRIGSSWEKWYTYLFGGDYVPMLVALPDSNISGIQYPYITGGWTASEDDADRTLGKYTIANTISISSEKATTAVYAHTVNPINLSGVRTIYAEVENASGSPVLCIYKEGSTFNESGKAKEVVINNTGVFALDVRDLTENYYITIGASGASSSCTVSAVYMQYGSQD